MARILVTGADGFVGRALSARLHAAGHTVLRVVRVQRDRDAIAVGDIGEYTLWPSLLSGIDVVVHLAARAHVMHERLADPFEEFRRINVVATLSLARAAAAAGVRRFVFLSSIGVNGVATTDRAFSESDTPDPTEPYAVSKWDAERGLVEIGTRTGLEIVRIRPPLVVGPGVKGNLRRLLKLVRSRIPLPLGALNNSRNFVPLEDLCELLALCTEHERASGELLLAANPEAISTPDLLRAIAEGLGCKLRLVSVPLPILGLVARIVGAEAELKRVASSLHVNADRAHELLSWRSDTSLRESIRSMAQSYLLEQRGDG